MYAEYVTHRTTRKVINIISIENPTCINFFCQHSKNTWSKRTRQNCILLFCPFQHGNFEVIGQIISYAKRSYLGCWTAQDCLLKFLSDARWQHIEAQLQATNVKIIPHNCAHLAYYVLQTVTAWFTRIRLHCCTWTCIKSPSLFSYKRLQGPPVAGILQNLE